MWTWLQLAHLGGISSALKREKQATEVQHVHFIELLFMHEAILKQSFTMASFLLTH